MKKIFNFLLLLAGITSVMSCGEKDATYDGVTPLPIKNANVLFTANGGDGSIVTNTSFAIKASTDAQWIALSVNGNTVTVTAEPNASLEARSAKIVLNAEDGTTASVTATQHGLLLALNAKDSYLFDTENNDPAIIADKSNIIYDAAISADWIHLEKVLEGYAITVDPNESGNYRHGSITLSFEAAQFTKTINVGQWGNSLPFDQLTTATYTDESGAEHTKTISIVADASKENAYLVKGLLAEGDIQLLYNANNTEAKEWYIPSGYLVGTLTEEGTTYNLRCMMSAATVNSGNRYIPTTATTSATSGYRMAFNWEDDGTGNIGLNYVRNSNLSTNYSTDGIIVCKYTGSSVSAGSRKGIVYYFLNLNFK